MQQKTLRIPTIKSYCRMRLWRSLHTALAWSKSPLRGGVVIECFASGHCGPGLIPCRCRSWSDVYCPPRWWPRGDIHTSHTQCVTVSKSEQLLLLCQSVSLSSCSSTVYIILSSAILLSISNNLIWRDFLGGALWRSLHTTLARSKPPVFLFYYYC